MQAFQLADPQKWNTEAAYQMRCLTCLLGSLLFCWQPAEQPQSLRNPDHQRTAPSAGTALDVWIGAKLSMNTI